jgi:hypothetical protein
MKKNPTRKKRNIKKEIRRETNKKNLQEKPLLKRREFLI